MKAASPLINYLPNNLDFVDHLGHAIQVGNSRLCQLLQVETWNLAAEIEPHALIFTPDSLHRQMRLVQNTVLRQGEDLIGLFFVRQGFQDSIPLGGPAVKTSVLMQPLS